MSSQNDLNINNFNGPLDLLLELVKEKHMDIFDIDLAELATAYVKLIESLKETNFDLASEYLVMAATLIQLKAIMLLENPNDNKKIEKEKENILKQLVEYQQFKKIALNLKEREKERTNIYIKKTENYNLFESPQDVTHLDGSLSGVKLMMQMQKMFERVNSNKIEEITIETFNLSPTQRRLEILEILKVSENSLFEKIFNVPTMNHFVITMLTILDMSRKQEVILKQEESFGEIMIEKGMKYDRDF